MGDGGDGILVGKGSTGGHGGHDMLDVVTVGAGVPFGNVRGGGVDPVQLNEWAVTLVFEGLAVSDGRGRGGSLVGGVTGPTAGQSGSMTVLDDCVVLPGEAVGPEPAEPDVGGARYGFHGSGELDCPPSVAGHSPVLGYGGRITVLGVTWPPLCVMSMVIGEIGMTATGVKTSPPLRPGPT